MQSWFSGPPILSNIFIATNTVKWLRLLGKKGVIDIKCVCFKSFQKYYFTVTAVSSAGNTEVSSDGVTMVTENDVLTGVSVYDGKPCTMTGKFPSLLPIII